LLTRARRSGASAHAALRTFAFELHDAARGRHRRSGRDPQLRPLSGS
jgi:hypothetical protein